MLNSIIVFCGNLKNIIYQNSLLGDSDFFKKGKKGRSFY